MKHKQVIIILMLTLVVNSACQTPIPTAIEEVEQKQVESSVTEIVKAEEITYPEPGGEVDTLLAEPQSLPEVLYPMYEDKAQMMWSQAQAMILNGEVERILTNESLQITLLLKDGRTIFSEEPDFDAVEKLIDACGEPCKDIEIESE